MSTVAAAPAVARAGSVRARRLTSTLLAAAALAFLLPFGTVSCDGEEVSFTGVELATFQVDADERHPGGTLAEDVEQGGSPIALVTLAIALVGAGTVALRGRGGGFAAAGVAGLFVLFAKGSLMIDSPTVDHGSGYLLAATALAAAGGLRFVVRVIERERAGRNAWPLVVALMLGVPVTAVVLLYLTASGP
jgi:hypothetical protein